MNPNDFEKHLQRQPLRPIPPEWRAEILQQATTAGNSSFVIRHSFLSTINHQLSTILWLRPKAWAGLAAVWVLIFALRFSSRDNLPKMAQSSPAASQQMMVNLREQQQILAELIGTSSGQTHDVDRPKPFAPQPHSERRTATTKA